MKRKVVQWAIGYAAVGVVVVEVLDVVGGRFVWPEWILEGGIVVVSYGLLATMVLAWFHGERGRQRVEGMEVLLLLMVLGACGMTLWMVRGEGEPDQMVGSGLSGGILGAPVPNQSRIAILPFNNLSAQGETDACLVDGLHDEIITQISKVSALEVVSRTSVLRYRGQDVPSAVEIGRELGVWYLLEGSVMRAGDQIRVRTQLIDTRTDVHLWADSYDQTPSASNLFDLQSDVAFQVAQALQATLLPTEITRIEQAYTRNDEAYWSYLRGLRASRGYASVNVPTALGHFQRDVELDPDFALGWEALSMVYMNMGNYFLMPAETAFLLSEEAVARALELDPTLTHAKGWLEWLEFSFHRDWEAAEEIFLDVLAENEDFLEARLGLAYVLQATGRMDEAAAEGEALVRIDPTSGYGHRIAAPMLHIARRFDEAERVMGRAMEMVPAATGAHLYQALTLEQLGRFDEAFGELRFWAFGNGRPQEDVSALEERFAAEGMAGAWGEWLRWHLSAEEPRSGPVAIGYARLGKAHEAVQWLSRGAQE
jgi:TolB-like protein